MKTFLLVVVVMSMLFGGCTLQQSEQKLYDFDKNDYWTQMYDRVVDSVVLITVEFDLTYRNILIGNNIITMGTGFFVRGVTGDVFVVTASHVIQPWNEIKEGSDADDVKYKIYVKNELREDFDVEVVYTGDYIRKGEPDISILKLKNVYDSNSLSVLTFKNEKETDQIQPMDFVFSVGYPLVTKNNIDNLSTQGFVGRVRWQQIDEKNDTHFILVDSTTEKGLSGAPVLDSRENVIGVVIQYLLDNNRFGVVLSYKTIVPVLRKVGIMDRGSKSAQHEGSTPSASILQKSSIAFWGQTGIDWQ